MTERTNDTRTAPPFLEYLRAGLSVIPIAADGSKAPARIGGWKRYATTLPTEEQCIAWKSKFHGIAVLGGKASGGLEIIDIDSPELVEPFLNLVRDESSDLAGMLTIVRTPRRDEQGRGGRHVYYRCSVVDGNQKLAMSEPRPTLGADGEPVRDGKGRQRMAPVALIETRGQGGYVLAPGCAPECHPSGNEYEHVDGPTITDIQTITSKQRDILFRCARMFDRSAVDTHKEPRLNGPTNGSLPGDDYAANTEWEEILEPAGWTKVGCSGEVSRWRRPGKDNGWSATTGLMSKEGNELLCVFSSNAHPFDGPDGGKSCSTYSKFAAYALLNHDGDFKETARRLAELGFGTSSTSAPKNGRRASAPEVGEKKVVFVRFDEAETTGQTMMEIGPGVYQRSGALVHIVTDLSPCRSVQVASGALRIRELPSAILRERVTEKVRLVRQTDKEIEPVRPPAWLINAIHQRGEWPPDVIPPLVGIIRSPSLRSDYSVLQLPGYDPMTGLFYSPDGEFPPVPDSPSLDDAKAAADELLDVVCDFPFVRIAGEDHRVVWLAYILTLAGRPAILGPCPLFVFDAPAAGSGKSLLVDVASICVFGTEAARYSWTGDDAELRKTITAVAIEALPAVLLDNLAGDIRSAALDACLTGTIWRDRVLGKSETTGALPLATVWAVTGNNVQLQGDTSRRALFCRLEPDVDDPEARTGFRHENLTGWIHENRHRLAVAAVTILRAYAVAGCPQAQLAPWGSYVGWTALVRQAVVWMGFPDPAATRRLARAADRTWEVHRLLLDGIESADDGEGLSAAEIVKRAEDPTMHPILSEAVAELCGAKPDPRKLGYKLRRYKGRRCEGRFLVSEPGHNNTQRWQVQRITGGDGGDGGDVSTNLTREKECHNSSGKGISSEQEMLKGLGEYPPSPPSPPAQRQQGVIE